MKNKRSPFTLFELMVCLALLAVIAGFVGLKSHTLLAESRYKQSVKQLYNELETLQVVAMALRCDIQVEIDKKQMKIITDEPLLIKRSKVKLFGISEVLWNRKPVRNLSFEISSQGWIDLKGSVELCHGDEKAPLFVHNLKISPDKLHSIPPKPKENNAPTVPSV